MNTSIGPGRGSSSRWPGQSSALHRSIDLLEQLVGGSRAAVEILRVEQCNKSVRCFRDHSRSRVCRSNADRVGLIIAMVGIERSCEDGTPTLPLSSLTDEPVGDVAE